MLVNLKEMLQNAQAEKYAVGAFGFCNAETALATLEEGNELRSPVMFITGPIEVPLLGVKNIVRMINAFSEAADVPICLHLDHAENLDLIRECVEAGFPSVMIDGSHQNFEENIKITRLVVDMAKPFGVTVEGELGAVGRADKITVEGRMNSSLTDPLTAAEFVERTGVDALAISIGNAHGMYSQQPELDLERLQAIRNVVDVPLVLHGGSGTPPDQLKRAINMGICKVNVASELAKAYINTTRDVLAKHNDNIWYSLALIDAKAAVRDVVRRWMHELGSTGRIK